MDVNGSVRGLFDGVTRYVGIDFREGPGVDRIMDAHHLEFGDSEFDVVISTEMLEHDSAFWLSLQEMGRVLRLGGLLIITARGNGFIPHGYPHDYWRFMPQSVEHLLALAGCEVLEALEDWQPGHPGIFALGRRVKNLECSI
jgi:SAM-dependent methyltransferase